MRVITALLALFLFSLPACAHVGSADVYFEGDAGPYPLFVTIRLPQVIPGVAEIQIRSSSPDVRSIEIVPSRLTGPAAKMLSAPDVARRSKEDPQFFVCNLWLMEFGALQVHVRVQGSHGEAELSVPIASFARKAAPFGGALRFLLIFFFLALALTGVLIIGAVVRDSTVPPGRIALPANSARARLVMGFGLFAAVITLFMGRAWWNVEAAFYQRNVDMLRPPQAETALLAGNRLLIRPAKQLEIPDAGRWEAVHVVKMNELLPDHGHLMHLFLISEPGMDRMWHLHPDPGNKGFIDKLPSMPAGRYALFADIVDQTGYPWTLVANVSVPTIDGAPLTGDDSQWRGNPLQARPSQDRVSPLEGGGRLLWERDPGPLRANTPVKLRFLVQDADRSPARDLEPYMGMAAHAEIVSADLGIFAHIHPSGTVPMAALDLAQGEIMSDSMQMAMPATALSPEFSFPYGFPRSGTYRIFVQFKRSGRVQGAAFDAQVQ